MPKNYYLSPNEQRIMDIATDADIIITEDLTQAAGMPAQSVRNALSSLAGKGRLFRVKRGIYLKCEEPDSPVIEDPKRLALHVFKGYIAFSSALQHWGLLEYESFDVFVATRDRSGSREIGEYKIQAVSMGDKAQGMVFDRGIFVSSLEKTIFDCIYKPQHSGGYPLVAKAISESSPNWEEVFRWFDVLGTDSLVQRAGYVLSKAVKVPSWLLKNFRSRAKSKVWLNPSGRRTGRYIKNWKILDNVGGWNDGG